MELEKLIIQFQKKDEVAFEKLYTMYAENICGAIYTIVQDTSRAEEIVQDVFVKAWNKAESYDASKGRFFTWILNIARNAAIDEVRSKSFKEQKQNLTVDYFVGILEATENEEETPNIAPLRASLLQLKEKCIQVISMLYFRGYTQKEVAEELNIPLGTIKTRNRNCISQLRANMSSHL